MKETPAAKRKNNNPASSSLSSASRMDHDEKLYRPMLLRFRCYGAFSLTPSDETDSREDESGHKKGSHGNSVLQHHCLGIRSRLLPLGEYPSMTAHDALQNFAHATSSREDRSEIAAGFGGANGHAVDGQEEPAVLPHIIDPKWMELQAHLDEDDERNGRPSPSSQSLTNFRTSLPPRSRMDFYGSTDVGVLLLRPHAGQQQQQLWDRRPRQVPDRPQPSPPATDRPLSNEQYSNVEVDPKTMSESIIYAISPENTFGLSVREMNVDDEAQGTTTGGTIGTVKVGVLEVSLASRHEGIILDEDEDEDEGAFGKGWGIGGEHEEDVNGSQGRPGIDDQRLEGYYDKLTSMGKKLGKSMSLNADFITNELQDDFLARTVAGGEKVVQSFSKQLQRMEKLAGDFYTFLSDTRDGSGGGSRRR